jgi:hypothetical protein
MVDYDKAKNYFKFTYEGDNDAKILFRFEEKVGDLYLTDPHGERHYLERRNQNYKGNLTYDGTYYLEINCKAFICELGGRFWIMVPGSIKTIDLNKSVYSQENSFYIYDEYLDMIKFKVSNLQEEKYVFFETIGIDDYYKRYNVPYYPGEDPPPYNPPDPYGPFEPDFSNLTIFEVINNKTGERTRNVRIYKFEPNNEYIINVHCLVNYWNYKYSYEFRYAKYIFMPIIESQIKKIIGNEGIISLNGPIVGLINSNNPKEFYIIPGTIGQNNILYAKTEQDIESNLELLSTLEFNQDDMLKFRAGEMQNTFFIVLPLSLGSKINLFIADEFDGECKNSYEIPANTPKFIYCDEGIKKNNFLYFNYVLTYKSDHKNMRVMLSDGNEATDYVIQNYLGLIIYVEKTNKDCTITMRNYTTKFAYFGAENSYIFNIFYNYLQKMLNFESNINLSNYLKLTQLNIRIGTEYIPWFEFYNIYFNQLNVKVNLFIRQLYGGSELYECDASDYDIHDLQFLTTPISNEKCKNKKSVFNRLFPLDGTKVLSGYIAPDSYFDAYAEIVDDTKKEIDISLLMENDLPFRNNAKYLKKDVEYKINFDLNHLIKLEPGFDATIAITDGQTTTSLSSKYPTVKLSGEGYTMKSDKDAMVYFYGRLPDEYLISQIEIDMEKSKGKIIKISGISNERKYINNNSVNEDEPDKSDEKEEELPTDSEDYNEDKSSIFGTDIIIDFGFKNYYPASIPMGKRIRENGILYLDNFYEKMKVKLVEGEKLYIYCSSELINKLKIEYIGKNLNNKNNDYNIFLIPNNNQENTLIINTAQDDLIITDFFFCKSDTILKLSFLGEGNETEYTFTNNNFSEQREFGLFRGDNKMTFNTNQPVVFTYSYIDLIDEDLFNEKK